MMHSEAFPVPTLDNPTAVFTKEEFAREKVQTATTSLNERQVLLKELALARQDNRQKTAEDYRRGKDFELCKRTWKLESDKEFKHQREMELSALGLPETCAYMLESSQYALRRRKSHAHFESRDMEQDLDAKVYEKSLERIIAQGEQEGGNKLVRDLAAREERNAKRTKPDFTQGDGINKQNHVFNKSLSRTMAGDARAQTIKQSFERGTAL
ncbi:hypothetical protein BASA81_000542 [Batrachochytrium salamandrivorans]|nr:hypothetical protein BASA81_000542 [Batrachochytrium salamandrivorans]